MALVSRIGLRMGVCAVATYLAWLALGRIGVALSALLWAVLLARPILELFGESQRAVKTLALADVEGRHYVHRGIPLDIAQDERHQRWLSVRDVRKVLPGFPRDAIAVPGCAWSARWCCRPTGSASGWAFGTNPQIARPTLARRHRRRADAEARQYEGPQRAKCRHRFLCD